MSEGRITISPTVQILSVPATNSSQNRSTVPAGIANLASGSTLKGFVVNRDQQNNPIIRTDKGDVSIRSELFLKTGSEVALKIEKNVAGANARLVSVDGTAIKELIEQVTQQTNAQQGDSISKTALQNSAQTATGTATATPSQLAVLKAILLQPLSQAQIKTLPAPLQTLAQNLLEGNALNIRIVTQPSQSTAPSISQPLQTVAQQQNALNPAQLSSAYSRYTGKPAPLAPAPLPGASAFGGSVAFQIQTIAASSIQLQGNSLPAPLAALFAKAEIAALNTATAPPPLAPATTAPPQASLTPPPLAPASPVPTAANAALAVSANGTQVTAHVIGNDQGGYSTVQTPIGTLRIPAPTPLSIGSTITLDLSPTLQNLGSAAATLHAPVQQGPSEWLGISRDWAALSSMVAILQDADPAAAQHMEQRNFAQSDKSLTKGVLFFLSALRANSPREWLGQNLMQHRDARVQELVKKVLSDFSAMRPMSEPSEQPWQSAFIPVMHEREPEQLRVFWRDYDKASDNDEKKGERFIIEATLSELGELQFDGLVNTKTTPTSFDLAIRTHQPLEDTMKRDIQSLFLSAAEVAGFTGQLRFYEKPEHMEHPLEEMVKSLQQKATGEGVDNRSILA